MSPRDSSAAGQPWGASDFSHAFRVNHIFLPMRVLERKTSGGQGSLVWPRLAGAGGSTGIKLCSQEGLQEPLFLEGRLGEN